MLLTLPSWAPTRVLLLGVAHANRTRPSLVQKKRMIKEWRGESLRWRIVNGLCLVTPEVGLSVCGSDLRHEARCKKHFVSKACECSVYFLFAQLEMLFPTSTST